MHEEFQSNWQGANDQYKRCTLCHSKVILKGSMIVTCYLLGKARRGRRRRRGRSGKTAARCFLGEVRRTPTLPGPEALPIASPGGFISCSCLPRSREQPRMVLEISPALPWPRRTPILFGPFLSHHHPLETQVSETLSSLALQVPSLALAAAARQPHRAASRGSLSLLPVQVAGAQALPQTVAAHPALPRPPRVQSIRATGRLGSRAGL